MGISKKSLVGIAAIVIVVAVLSGFLYNLNGDSLDFSDTETRVVISGSMDGEPREEYEIQTIPVGSLVFIHQVPPMPAAYDFYKTLEIGDVVTFYYSHPTSAERMVVTHRIIDITESGGDISFWMAGDSVVDKLEEDESLPEGDKQMVFASSGDMIGKVVGVSPALGSLMVFLSSAEGKAVLIGVFAAIIVAIWVAPVIYRYIVNKGS